MKSNNLILSIAILFGVHTSAVAASLLEGKWAIMNSMMGNHSMVVEVFQTETGTLDAKIIKNNSLVKKCKSCKGNLKNKSLEGMVILTDMMQKAGNPRLYENGKLLNLKSGAIDNVLVKISNSNLVISDKQTRKTYVWKRIE